MDYIGRELLQRIEEDPEFQKFSYDQQVQIRMRAIDKILMGMPEFDEINDPNVRAEIKRKIFFRPPKLNDKQLEKNVTVLGKQFRAGNQKAQRNVFEIQGLNDMFTATAAGGLASKIARPILNAIQPKTPDSRLQWFHMADDEDKRKVLEYFNTIGSLDRQYSLATKGKRKFIATSTNIAEIIGVGAITAGSWAFPAGLGRLATNISARIGAKAGSRGVMALARTSKIIGHGAIEGGVGVIREALKEQLNKVAQDDPEARNVFNGSLKHFKDYFLWDVLINFGLSVVLPQLGGIGKVISGKLNGKQWIDGLTDSEWEKWMRKAVRGESVPNEVMDQLSPASKSWFETTVATGRVNEKVVRATKEDLLKMVAGSEGYSFSRVDDGIDIFNAAEKVARVKNLEEFESWFARNMDQSVKGVDTATYGAGAKRMGIREKVKGDMGSSAISQNETAINVIAPEGGKFSPKQVKDFSRLMLVNSGASDDAIKSVKSAEVGNFIEVSVDDKVVGRISKEVGSKADELSEVDSLLSGLDDYLGNTVPTYGQAPYVRSYATPKRVGVEYSAPNKYLTWKGKEIPQSGKKWFKNPQEAKDFMGYVRGQGDEISGMAKVRKTLSEDVLADYQEGLANQYLFTPAYTENLLGKYDIQLRRTKQGKWATVAQNGDYQIYESLSDIGKDIMKRELKFDDIAWYLRRYEGLYLRYKSKGSDAVIVQTSKDAQKLGLKNRIVYEAESLRDLIDQYPQLINRLPDRLAPKMTLISRSGGKKWVGRINYTRNAAVGDQHTVMRHLGNFYEQDTAASVYLGPNKYGHIKAKRTAGTYEVFLNDIGERRIFRSVKQARSYLSRSSDDMNLLKYRAATAGYRLDVGGAYYALYNSDGLYKKFGDLDTLKAELASVPEPEFAPSLVGKAWDDYADQFPKPEEGAFKPTDFTAPKTELSGWNMLGHRVRPRNAVFEQVFEKTGDDDWIRWWTEIENSARALDAVDEEVLRTVNTAFRKGNKWIPWNRRQTIGRYLRKLNEGEDAGAAFARDMGMNAEDFATVDRIRKIFGENEQGGLFHAFDVSYDDFINVYLPRIRANFNRLAKNGMLPDGEINKFLDATFDGHAPRELKEFFKHQRVSAVATTALIDDPLELLTRYAQIGYRKRYLGPVWDRITKEFQAKKPSADPNISAVFQNYLDDMMGIKSGAEKQLLNMTMKIGDAVKKMPILRQVDDVLTKKFGVDTTVSKDFIDYIRGVSYLSAMGGRFWLAVRNTFQPWITTAPRIGNEWVAKGLRSIVRDDGSKMDWFRKAGVVRSNMPVAGSQVFDGTGMMSKASRFLLKWYGNSDDLNRAVTYEAMRLRFNDAVGKYTKKVINEDQFMELSGVNVFDDFTKEQAKGFIRQGQWSTAMDLLGKRLVDETQFIYRAGGRPDLFRGTVGRVFGQFGTWPVYYVENIRRAMRNGSTASKMAFAATWATNSFLIYEGFKNLGVNANNFLIWSPMQFTGGPLFSLGYNATQMLGGGHYRSRQARSEVLGLGFKDGKLIWDPSRAEIKKWIIPGSFMARSAKSGIDALNAGDYWRAALNFGSFPISQEWFQSGGAELGIKSPFD